MVLRDSLRSGISPSVVTLDSDTTGANVFGPTFCVWDPYTLLTGFRLSRPLRVETLWRGKHETRRVVFPWVTDVLRKRKRKREERGDCGHLNYLEKE